MFVITWLLPYSNPGRFPKWGETAEWSGFLEGAGSLQNLLAPIAVLQTLGSAESFQEKIKALRVAGNVNRDCCRGDFPIRSDEQRERMADELKQFEERLEQRRQATMAAENALRKMGWRYNTEARKATKGKGHRGRDLIAECAWAIYTARYKDKGNTFDTRRRISRALAPYFEASELSPRAGAPIYMAIYNRERSPK
jgi:hypothetical protein